VAAATPEIRNLNLPNRRGFRLLDAGLAQEPRRLLRRRRVDIKPGPPLESRRLRQFRHELDVPVIVIIHRILHG